MPRLPGKIWLLQAGVLVNFLGNGMVAPFLVIYLHFGRGIPVAVAGSAVALGGITAVISGLAAGSLAERLGPRNILVAAMVSNAVAYFLYTRVTVPWEAFGVGLLVGAGTGAYGPSSQNLIASLVRAEDRQVAFAQNRVTSVVGLGLGGAVGGVAAARGLDGYLSLLRLDAITFLLFAALCLLLPTGRAVIAGSAHGGYAQVVRDRAFVALVAVNMAMVAAGIAPMMVLLPAFAKTQAHISETAIGALYALNTLTIVAAQLPLTRATRARGRLTLLRAAALLWVGSWLVCFGAGWLGGTPSVVAFAFAAVVYAIGECCYTSVILPATVALAPPALRGRYLGAMALSWQSGFLLGPSVGAFVLGGLPAALPLVCAAGCLGAAVGTLEVDRRLAPERRRAIAVAA